MAQSATDEEMTYGDYREEIQAIADVVENADIPDMEPSELVFEEVDSHQWIIYTAYHLDILQHSDEEPDEWKHLVADGDDWRDVLQALAFDAMRNDVWAELHDRDTDF